MSTLVEIQMEGVFFRSFFCVLFFFFAEGVPSKARKEGRKEGMSGERKEGRKEKKRKQERKEER